VFGVSTKGKITTKAKLIGRRLVAESEFLDDLGLGVMRSYSVSVSRMGAGLC
jgi:hypothetical protein